MLIRSQKKNILVSIEESGIYIKEKNLIRLIGIGIPDNEHDFCIITNKFLLGSYSTKEKAIRVLDDIEDNYQYNMEAGSNGIRCPQYVFQMPKDEEVPA